MKLGIKIWILVVFLIFSLLFIFGLPPKAFDSGVIVTEVSSNSTLFDQGLRPGQIIISIDGEEVKDLNSYSEIVSKKFLEGIETTLVIKTKEKEYTYYGNKFPELSVIEISKSNIKLGLDLAGGSRALIKAENRTLTQSELGDLVDITQNRLNAFGLTDLKVSPVIDLSGNNFMLIEITGATPKDLRELISKQAKF